MTDPTIGMTPDERALYLRLPVAPTEPPKSELEEARTKFEEARTKYMALLAKEELHHGN